ncbi:MAG: (Fe-S)-binding protein [Desulfobacterales bacterium]
MFKEDRCTLCGECLMWCPYIDISEEESKIQIEHLIKGDTSRIISECISCMGCSEICPEGADPFSLIVKRQEEQGEGLRFEQPEQNMEMAYRLPAEIQGNRTDTIIDLCSVYALIPGLFEGSLFDGATFIKGGKYFCGIGFYHISLPGKVEKNAAAVVSNVAETGAGEVVCYHDDCYTFFKAVAPELGIRVPFHPVSWPEFMYRRLEQLKSAIRPIDKTVAYQRPCSSRYTPEKDPYVDAVFELVGAEKPTRSFEGVDALCCGGAIVPRNPEMANDIKHKNLKDAHDAGAEIMVTLCPLCYANLRKRAPEHGLTVLPISNLCRAALGEIPLT